MDQRGETGYIIQLPPPSSASSSNGRDQRPISPVAMSCGKAYCCSSTMMPRNEARIRLWTKVRRITSPSLPLREVVETPVVTFCGEIILLVTAPEELVAAIRTGLRWSCLAATTCRLPKSALLDVSLPLRKQAIQPMNTEKKGKIPPTAATASPRVYTMPE